MRFDRKSAIISACAAFVAFILMLAIMLVSELVGGNWMTVAIFMLFYDSAYRSIRADIGK